MTEGLTAAAAAVDADDLAFEFDLFKRDARLFRHRQVGFREQYVLLGSV